MIENRGGATEDTTAGKGYRYATGGVGFSYMRGTTANTHCILF
jgi:hypothetical protein